MKCNALLEEMLSIRASSKTISLCHGWMELMTGTGGGGSKEFLIAVLLTDQVRDNDGTMAGPGHKHWPRCFLFTRNKDKI